MDITIVIVIVVAGVVVLGLIIAGIMYVRRKKENNSNERVTLANQTPFNDSNNDSGNAGHEVGSNRIENGSGDAGHEVGSNRIENGSGDAGHEVGSNGIENGSGDAGHEVGSNRIENGSGDAGHEVGSNGIENGSGDAGHQTPSNEIKNNSGDNEEKITSFKQVKDINQDLVELIASDGVGDDELENIICAWAIFEKRIVGTLCDGYNGLSYINELIDCFDIIYREVSSVKLKIEWDNNFFKYNYSTSSVNQDVDSVVLTPRGFGLRPDASIFQGFISMLKKIEKLESVANILEKMDITESSKNDQRRCANEIMKRVDGINKSKHFISQDIINRLIMVNSEKITQNDKKCSLQCVDLRSKELSKTQTEFCARVTYNILDLWRRDGL
jgi:hypothetical protein